MKKIIFSACIMLFSLCSCTEKEYESKDIIGEWKANKIEATFSNGNTLTITDPEDIEFELDGLDWIKVTESTIQSMSLTYEYGYEVILPYGIYDNEIIFTGAEKDATYLLESATETTMTIKYISDWTSLIHYNRLK